MKVWDFRKFEEYIIKAVHEKENDLGFESISGISSSILPVIGSIEIRGSYQ